MKHILNTIILLLVAFPQFSNYTNLIDENRFLDKVEVYRRELEDMEMKKYIVYSDEAEDDMSKFNSDDVYYYIEREEN